MIRFSTILLFLFLLLVIFCVAIWNRLSVLDYALQAARDDCLEDLLTKNKLLLDQVADEKLSKAIKKQSKAIDDDYRLGVEAQNTINTLLAEFLEENGAPKQGSATFKSLKKVADLEDMLASKQRFFNSKAYKHNTMVQTIPASWIALAVGKKEVPLFALDDDESAGISADWGNE